MEIKEIKNLREVITKIEQNYRFNNNDELVVNLYNSILKLYNNLDILFNMYDYNTKLIPSDKKIHHKSFISSTINGMNLNYNLMRDLGISSSVLEDCKFII